MLSIPMGSTDLSRTTFESSPLLNLLRGLLVLSDVLPPSPAERRWLRDARRRFPARARPILELITAGKGYLPTFLIPEATPSAGRAHRSPDDELQALRAASDADLAYDVEALTTFVVPGTTSRIVRELADRRSALVPLLTDAVRATYDAVLSPDWPDIRRILDAEIGSRGRQMAADGTAAALNDVHPRLSWRPDVLELQTPIDRPFLQPDLRGQGLVFLPCLLGGGQIGTLIKDDRRSLFGYPLRNPSPSWSDGGGSDRADARLAGLIGRGRAAALRAISDGVTTTELAHVLRVGAPTASAHAAALRAAGLVVTERTGRSVQHRLTGLGADLLAANPW